MIQRAIYANRDSNDPRLFSYRALKDIGGCEKEQAALFSITFLTLSQAENKELSKFPTEQDKAG